MDIPKLISYYKDCYQADTRTLSVTNFFNAKVENRYFFEGNDELLNGNLKHYPLPPEYAEAVEKNLAIYKREKVLYCSAFFIIGTRQDTLRKESKVCAPLLLYPSKIVSLDGLPHVEVDFSRRLVNINFLNSIRKEEVDDLYESLVDRVEKKISDLGSMGVIRRILERSIEDFDGEELLLYPQLYSESRIKRQTQPKQLAQIDGYKIVPAIALGVVRRSSSTQGIISELIDMSRKGKYSKPLDYLFNRARDGKAVHLHGGRVPAILSSAQQDVVEGADRNVVSLVIGPPGTGKSFTIASLALDYLGKGKSVLIASKTDQAVDVIHGKIQRDLGIENVALRAGKSDYKKSLKSHLQNLLSNTRRRPREDGEEEIISLGKRLAALEEDISRYAGRFGKQVQNELRWARFVSEYTKQAGLLKRLKMRYIRWRNSLQVPHWELSDSFLSAHMQQIQLAREYLRLTFNRQVHLALYHNRGMFRDFLKSLTARQSARQDLLFENIQLDSLLKTFPIWLVNMADIHDVFPLEMESFDLAIIDEATQCDIASCLPIMQRARRVVVVGDPKQLRHASFLSRSVQSTLLKKNNLAGDAGEVEFDFRNTSILDLINDRIDDQRQICFLDEHFRSKPDLIRFSNQQFYNNSLSIMTALPRKDQVSHISILTSDGERDGRGINKREATDILRDIKAIISEQAAMDRSMSQTMGVLSPFRDQADYLADQITKEIDLSDIEKHDISCGTAYSFQGEERDIMFISWVIDEQTHHSAILHLNKPDVFNVSITRARSNQRLYTSFSDRFDPGEYLGRYLSDVKRASNPIDQSLETIRDQFLSEVREALRKHDLAYWTSFSIAGLAVDLVFKRGDAFYGINLIGYPGMFVDALGIEDYKILTRASLPTFPLPYTYWKFDQHGCFDELMRFSAQPSKT